MSSVGRAEGSRERAPRRVSGLGGKAPACFLVKAHGRRLLLDLGAGPDAGAQPDLSRLGADRRVDAIVLSHAHGDHAGALDAWEDVGAPPIFATRPVASLVGHGAIRPLPLSGPAEILGIPIVTGRSGHAPGGVWLRLSVGRGLFYAGDMDFTDRLHARDAPPGAGTAVIDASYGDFDAPEAETRAALALALAGAGPVLLPVPAGGRGPEIALWVGRVTGRWPRIDAALREAARRLGAEWSGCVIERRAERLAALAAQAPPADRAEGVILAEAAALAGPVEAAGGRIVLTGHAARGHPAARLLEAGRAVALRWPVHPRLSENAALLRRLGARRVVPAFADARHLGAWRAAFAGVEVVASDEVAL